MTKFKVSAAWMQACDKGSEAKVFDVIRIDDYTNKGAAKWCAQMVIVNDNGHEWAVAVGRGELVHMCTACGEYFPSGAHMSCPIADSYKDEEVNLNRAPVYASDTDTAWAAAKITAAKADARDHFKNATMYAHYGHISDARMSLELVLENLKELHKLTHNV